MKNFFIIFIQFSKGTDFFFRFLCMQLLDKIEKGKSSKNGRIKSFRTASILSRLRHNEGETFIVE